VADKHQVQVGRAYDPRARGDGLRVLVDRIWPRGLSKAKADLDEWCKQVAPSTELRKGMTTIRSSSTSSAGYTALSFKNRTGPKRYNTCAP